MTDESKTFAYTTYIRSTREQVWQALTEPEFTKQYWNGRIVESDWRVGSTVTVRHDYDDEVDFTGAVLEADRPRRLRYGMHDSEVTFELTDAGEVVVLTVFQTGLDEKSYRSISGGWSFITSNLKTLLETGQTLPMPEKTLAAYR
jgi:uncharacterized protein YndB with AHSA1/START domain